MADYKLVPVGMWQRFVAWYVARLCTCDAYYGIQDPCCNYHSSAALEQENKQ
jgi:hypothetical protein